MLSYVLNCSFHAILVLCFDESIFYILCLSLIWYCFTVNLKQSMAAGFKMLMLRDTSGSYSTPLAPLTHLSETNTSSSQETVKG